MVIKIIVTEGDSHKKIQIWLIAMCSLFLLPTLSLAATNNLPDGFLISDDQGMKVTKDGQYFIELNDLLPGAKFEKNLVIKNEGTEQHSLKMYIEPVKNQGPANLLKNIDMVLDYNHQTIFDGNLVNQDKTNIQKGTVVDFGVLSPNQEIKLAINMHVHNDIPWENFIKNESFAVVRWTFVAQKDKPTNSDVTDKPIVKPTGRFPQTGEKKVKFLFTLGALMLLASLLIYRQISRENQLVNKDNLTK